MNTTALATASLTTTERSARLLSPEEVEAFQSPYLAGGYREDRISLMWTHVSDDAVECCARMDASFIPSDGKFHLAVPIAFNVIAQAAIVYGHISAGFEKKVGEVWLRSLKIQCRRPVANSEEILFVLTCTHKRRNGNGLLFAGDIDVDDGAFIGKGSFFLPLPGAGS